MTIANNTLLPGVTSTADPNDPRWLPTQGIDPLLTPRPTPTAIPYTDFPLARYDIGNTGRVPYLSLTPMRSIWPDGGRASGSFASPLAVLGQSVLASSSDNNLYGFYLEVGNQSWKLNLQAFTNLAPAIQDDLIYLAYGRTITAVRAYASASEWQQSLDADANTPFTIWLDSLFIGVGEGDGAKLVALRRLNPDDRKEFVAPISRIQLPAIGQETLFIGADRLWAVDINFWDGTENGPEIIWTNNDNIVNIAAPPVYSSPGVVRLAELYVVDSAGVVHAVDANTGVRFLPPFSTGGAVTALAVNKTNVYIVGNNVLRAVGRNDFLQRWQQPIAGNVRGGPFVTDDRVLVVTDSGAVQMFDAVAGIPLDSGVSLSVPPAANPAVGGGVLYVPGANNTIYAFRGQ